MLRNMTWTLAALVLAAGTATAADADNGLKKGKVELKSAGPIAFGPDNILLVGDPSAAAVYAIDTGDQKGDAAGAIKIAKVDAEVASLLGTTADKILVAGIAVNPTSGNGFLFVSRGKEPDAPGAIVKVDRKGKLTVLNLDEVKFGKANLANASEKQRKEAITNLAFVKGKVYVAGLSNEQFASTLRAIPFPFAATDKGTAIEIYHGAHGAVETKAPVRTFVAYDIGGETNLLAAYTCTPLVRLPVSDLKPGVKVRGTTIAELGNRNKPLDMIVYRKGGKDFILMANSSRGVMKIPTEGIEKIEGITKPIKGGGTAGLTYETIKELKGVEHLAKLDKDSALLLIRSEGGLSLDTVPLP
jgi:hypothetical protein